jgi:hypothetical protein
MVDLSRDARGQEQDGDRDTCVYTGSGRRRGVIPYSCVSASVLATLWHEVSNKGAPYPPYIAGGWGYRYDLPEKESISLLQITRD